MIIIKIDFIYPRYLLNIKLSIVIFEKFLDYMPKLNTLRNTLDIWIDIRNKLEDALDSVTHDLITKSEMKAYANLIDEY